MRLIDMTDPELKDYFQKLGAMIESVLPGEVAPGKGHNGHALFMLIVFDDPGVAQYVGSCSRENMVKVMRETANRFEQKEILER